MKFHLVGVISAVWGGNEIQKDILNSPFKDSFVFHGHSNDALVYMRGGDLLLFTSRAEAFPRTVAEYMAVGKPIVASDVSGVSEMIEHGVNGLLYNPDSPEELIEGISTLSSDSVLQRSMAERAKKTYSEKFSKKHHISKALRVFEEIEKC